MDTATIQPRMPHVAQLVPDAAKAMYALSKSAARSGLPETTKFLVHLRASQINGCSFCAEMHSRELEEAGEDARRIWTVAAWREAPYFSDAERAALELTEALTRIAGLRLVERSSDWHGAPLTPDSRSHISVWQKPAGA